MADYIPRPDAEFSAWANNFINYVFTHQAGLGVTTPEITPLLNLHAAWNLAYPAHISAQAAAESATTQKDQDREAFESAVRVFVRQLQASPEVDDAERQAMNITVQGAGPAVAVPLAKTRPILMIESSERLQQVVKWVDEATPTSRARPDWARGVQIYLKIGGAAPVGLQGANFVAFDTASPYLHVFADPAAGGQTAWWLAAWQATDGTLGPLSEPVEMTVIA